MFKRQGHDLIQPERLSVEGRPAFKTSKLLLSSWCQSNGPFFGGGSRPHRHRSLLDLLPTFDRWPPGCRNGGLAGSARTHRGTVLSIGDGDTLRVREGNRTVDVRLACIDAPESSQAPFGAQARQQLQALARVGSSVEMRIQATDRYGRSVAELTRRGQNLNQALVGSGAAFVYWRYIAGCDRQTYGRLENEARLKRLGIWGVNDGLTRPWDYRSNQRKPSSSSSTPAGPRYTCKQIGSYAQAQILLRQGHSYLDGNGDGEACESLQG